MAKRAFEDAFHVADQPDRTGSDDEFRSLPWLSHVTNLSPEDFDPESHGHGHQSRSREISHEAHGPDTRPRPVSPKPTRNFTATQACQTCRKKKTRCDETQPCSVCRGLGIECRYDERAITRKEASLAMVMKTLNRLESKLDNITQEASAAASPSGSSLRSTAKEPKSLRGQDDPAHVRTPTMERINRHASPESGPASVRVQISFSQHQVLFWPAIQQMIPDQLRETIQELGQDYAIDLEMGRPALSMNVYPYPATSGPSWLTKLPLSVVTGLSEAFFSTFDPTMPILDKDEYFTVTLGTVFQQGFGYDAESCLVLTVLALGCLAVKVHEEGGFPLPTAGSQDHDSRTQGSPIAESFEPPDWLEIIREKQPGLRFLNESRRRAGALMTRNDRPVCQFYLLSALYHSQIIRPIDSWAMINKACVCCLTLLKSGTDISWEDWEGDVISRLFWTSLMLESIWIQELNLPSSGLGEFESIIPIPKFTPYPHRQNQNRIQLRRDDTFFQFHFLAQVAHRIMLTRIRNTLYFYSETEAWPPPGLTQELYHQLEQWKENLPEQIQITDLPGVINGPHRSPAHIFATAMLHSRFKIARFHISRPFLYKALHSPSLLTDFDLQACRAGLEAAMHWPQITDIRRTMLTGIPLKFAVSSQFLGQLLIFHGIKNSANEHVMQTLPEGYQSWCKDMMVFLKECALLSQTVQKDVEILEALGW